jgi:thioredoxin-dependent peroxiredoxin
MIEQGEPAPDFTVPNQDGEPVTLSDLRGRQVVLYFYPRADTPGCTKQACGVRDCSAGAAVAKRYAVWTGHIERTTFLIDPDGVVARVFPRVKPAEHDDLVLGALT